MRLRIGTFLIKVPVVAEYQPDRGVTVHEVNLTGYAIRDHNVIGIHKAEKLTGATFNAGIPRNGTATTVTLVMVENSWMITADNLGGLICRAVVDDDDFQIPVGLRKDAVERLADKVMSVKRRDDNGNQGIGVHGGSLCLHWQEYAGAGWNQPRSRSHCCQAPVRVAALNHAEDFSSSA